MKIREKRVVYFISFLLMMGALIIMYATPMGIPGIISCYSDFKLPDMEFGYSYEGICTMFDHLSIEGLNHYLYYYVTDFFFIVGLAGVQLYLSERTAYGRHKWKKILLIFIAGRGLLDLIEDIIFVVMIKNILPVKMYIVSIVSVITILKFIFLILWIISIILCLISKGQNRKIGLKR